MQAIVPEPKDVVLVIDKSGSMNKAFSGSGTGYTILMNMAKEAAKTVVSTLNPHDRVSFSSPLQEARAMRYIYYVKTRYACSSFCHLPNMC